MQPEIEVTAQGDLLACALDDQAFDFVKVIQERLIDGVLEVGHPPAPRRAV